MTLPVQQVNFNDAVGPIGTATLLDSGTATYTAIVRAASQTAIELVCHNASGTYLTQALITSTVPFTWAAADKIAGSALYEAV